MQNFLTITSQPDNVRQNLLERGAVLFLAAPGRSDWFEFNETTRVYVYQLRRATWKEDLMAFRGTVWRGVAVSCLDPVDTAVAGQALTFLAPHVRDE